MANAVEDALNRTSAEQKERNEQVIAEARTNIKLVSMQPGDMSSTSGLALKNIKITIMGLYIQSLENIPLEAKRDYFIYLLDYGWEEPLGEALMKNYEKMAAISAENKAVVIRGTQRVHFEDEVFSWHNINGENATELLPAILITNRHPAKFRESFNSIHGNIESDLKLILIPLKKFCKTTTEVVNLIEKLFNDIKNHKDLDDFRIAKEIKRGRGRSLADEIILGPNNTGNGFDYIKLAKYFDKNPTSFGNVPLTLLPPQNWQDFEKMMKGIVDVIWEQEGWQIYGRSGQEQLGIDIYGYDDRKRFTGIQCKRKNITDSQGKLLTHNSLTESLIKKEIQKAKEIKNPSLERLIFATTSSRDVNVQDIIRKINDDRIKNSGSNSTDIPFSVEIWFWEDIQVHIEHHIQLMYWYYSEFLDKIHEYDKNIHILTLIRQAFTRPAFQREISREENGGDFIAAIKDTQEAINTGKLYNRRGDLIATSYSYSMLDNDDWKTAIWTAYKHLDKIRDIYQDGITSKMIRQHPTIIEVLDYKISDSFNNLRAECLREINTVLSRAGLPGIQSELLRLRR